MRNSVESLLRESYWVHYKKAARIMMWPLNKMCTKLLATCMIEKPRGAMRRKRSGALDSCFGLVSPISRAYHSPSPGTTSNKGICSSTALKSPQNLAITLLSFIQFQNNNKHWIPRVFPCLVMCTTPPFKS